MAITLTDVTPASWRRTKIFKVVSSAAPGTEDTATGLPQAQIAYDNDLSGVASPIANTKALADSETWVATRYECMANSYGARPLSVLFEASGISFTVCMEGGATGFITMRRPHTSTR